MNEYQSTLPVEPASPYLRLLKNRIDLAHIPFTDRSSRILVFCRDNVLQLKLSERWVKLESERGHYRQRPPILDDWQFTDADGQPLDFTITSYPHLVVFETAAGLILLTFYDTESPSRSFLKTDQPLSRRHFQFAARFPLYPIPDLEAIYVFCLAILFFAENHVVQQTCKSDGFAIVL